VCLFHNVYSKCQQHTKVGTNAVFGGQWWYTYSCVSYMNTLEVALHFGLNFSISYKWWPNQEWIYRLKKVGCDEREAQGAGSVINMLQIW